MDKNQRRLPLYKLPHFYKEAQEIRNKLLLWRLRNFNKVNLEEIEFGFPELEIFDRRVQQIITPIYYFSDENAKKQIRIFAKEQEMETKRQRRESLEGQIFEIIYENYSLSVFVDISLSSIAQVINKNTKYPVSERRIA